MLKLTKVTFEYEDGTKAQIIDPRGALLFQSRCNSSGIMSGLEDAIEILPKEEEKEKE